MKEWDVIRERSIITKLKLNSTYTLAALLNNMHEKGRLMFSSLFMHRFWESDKIQREHKVGVKVGKVQ